MLFTNITIHCTKHSEDYVKVCCVYMESRRVFHYAAPDSRIAVIYCTLYRNWCDRIIANMCARFIDSRFRSNSLMVIIDSRPDRMENGD